jgi:hypothetical protein
MSLRTVRTSDSFTATTRITSFKAQINVTRAELTAAFGAAVWRQLIAHSLRRSRLCRPCHDAFSFELSQVSPEHFDCYSRLGAPQLAKPRAPSPRRQTIIGFQRPSITRIAV